MAIEDEANKIAKALKPSKCPICGKEIHYLRYSVYELNTARFTEDGEYRSWDTLPNISGERTYECPECDAILFHDEESALAFLR